MAAWPPRRNTGSYSNNEALPVWGGLSSQIVRILDWLAAVGGSAGITTQRIDLLVDDLYHLMVRIDGFRKCHIEIVLMLFHPLTSGHSLPLQMDRIRGMMLEKSGGAPCSMLR